MSRTNSYTVPVWHCEHDFGTGNYCRVCGCYRVLWYGRTGEMFMTLTSWANPKKEEL